MTIKVGIYTKVTFTIRIRVFRSADDIVWHNQIHLLQRPLLH